MSGRAPSARALAHAILVEVEAGAWSDRLLAAREPLLPDARDRRFLHTLVLGTLRWQGAIDRLVAPRVTGSFEQLDAPVRAALRTAVAEALLLERPPPIAVDAAIEALREARLARAAGLVNAVLRRVLREVTRAALDPRATVPVWLRQRWCNAHGTAAADAMVAASLEPARAFLAAPPSAAARDAAARSLAEDGVVTAPGARYAFGLTVISGNPASARAFAAGEVVPLNEAAALVAALAAPDDARPVADLAAAPGGKAVLLARTAAGPLVAIERHRGRSSVLAAALDRLGGERRAFAIRGDAELPPLVRGAFGTVLLDAPCSGTGTLRRRPEKRFRLTPADVDDCAARQARMLDAAAPLVGPGGALVYAVCSVEPEEGPERVRAFLAAHPEFEAEDPATRLGNAATGLVEGEPPLLVTRPAPDHDLDGFVAARLVRR